MRIVGIILIILGALALAYKGITYTHEEEVVKIGGFRATAPKEETIPLPWYVGAIGIGAGVVLVIGGGGRKR